MLHLRKRDKNQFLKAGAALFEVGVALFELAVALFELRVALFEPGLSYPCLGYPCLALPGHIQHVLTSRSLACCQRQWAIPLEEVVLPKALWASVSR